MFGGRVSFGWLYISLALMDALTVSAWHFANVANYLSYIVCLLQNTTEYFRSHFSWLSVHPASMATDLNIILWTTAESADSSWFSSPLVARIFFTYHAGSVTHCCTIISPLGYLERVCGYQIWGWPLFIYENVWTCSEAYIYLMCNNAGP